MITNQTEPTAAELREFWERFGFKYSEEYHYGSLRKLWVYPDGVKRSSPPALTLDNLFKWAVPKLETLGYDLEISNDSAMMGWSVCCENLHSGCSMASPLIHCELERIAIALFRAIQQVIKEG
jgi:hypothetical protein